MAYRSSDDLGSPSIGDYCPTEKSMAIRSYMKLLVTYSMKFNSSFILKHFLNFIISKVKN